MPEYQVTFTGTCTVYVEAPTREEAYTLARQTLDVNFDIEEIDIEEI
jgi:hypothetical protein